MSMRTASNTSIGFQTYLRRRLLLFLAIGLVLVLQLHIIFSGSFQTCSSSAASQDVYTISKRSDNFKIDPKDALKPVSEHFWSAQDIENYVPLASRNTQLIYFITPTYQNPAQWVDIVRLSQTLMHDRLIYWIVVEDAVNCTLRIRNQLNFTGMMYAHLAAKTERQAKGKGVTQRNRALDHIAALNGPDGVVYFGDDDNAYDLRLFDELRKTKRVSIFGMGFTGNANYERCIVDSTTGKVTGVAMNWPPTRKFPMDMGGLAIHTSIVKAKKPRFTGRRGELETKFLELVADNLAELEPLNQNCTRIYSWHVKTGGTKDNRVKNDPAFDEIKGLV